MLAQVFLLSTKRGTLLSMHDFTLARKRMWQYQGSDACGIAARYKHRNNSMNRPRGRIDKMADGQQRPKEFPPC
jgi:hypothetical protein